MPSGAAHLERFQFNGATLIDETAGTPTAGHILFLHGWGGSRESLRGIGTLFAGDHAVHLLDLPGFGEAPPPPDGWGTIDYADLVQQYMLERLTGPVVLVGHSFGGRVSVRLAARRLPQVRALALIAVPGLPRRGWSRARVRRGAIRLLRRTLVLLQPLTGQRPVQWHSRRFGSKDYQAAGALRPLLVRTVTENLTESARSIICPTLLLWGSDDTETPLWLAHDYAALIGERATLVVLPHKDHHLYTGTGAHLCGEKIRGWLETVHA
ncbi:MAG: alpha/beta fold hydrolase [Vicinamibacterales bacterium]